jgi:hypothetical protein
MANLFISHRECDEMEAERLSVELHNAGHKVWFDKWDVEIGDSIVERINEGLSDSAYLILCFSSSGVTSDWISREWMSSLARQLSKHDVKILPVRLTGGEPPAILADIAYADLVKDWNKGVAQLLKAIR